MAILYKPILEELKEDILTIKKCQYEIDAIKLEIETRRSILIDKIIEKYDFVRDTINDQTKCEYKITAVCNTDFGVKIESEQTDLDGVMRWIYLELDGHDDLTKTEIGIDMTPPVM